MCHKKAEQAVQSVADTEDVSFVMQPGDISYSDGAERPFDRRITAFFPEGFSDAAFVFHGAKHGRESQKALVGIIIQKLFFHAGVRGEVGQSVVGVKEQTVFRKPSAIHSVGEGAAVAPIIIEGLREKVSGGSFQQAGIRGKPVLPQSDCQGDMEKMFFQKCPAKQLVTEAGGNPVMKKDAGIEQRRIDLLFQLAAVIESGAAYVLTLNFLFGGDGSIIAAYHVCVRFPCGGAHAPVHGGIDPVVAVHKGDIGAGRVSETFLPG